MNPDRRTDPIRFPRLVVASVCATIGFGLVALGFFASRGGEDIARLGGMAAVLGVLLAMSPYVICREAFAFGPTNPNTPENMAAVLRLVAYCGYVLVVYATISLIRTRFGDIGLRSAFVVVLAGMWGWMMGRAWLRFEGPEIDPRSPPRFDVSAFLGEVDRRPAVRLAKMLPGDFSRLIVATGCLSAGFIAILVLLLAIPVMNWPVFAPTEYVVGVLVLTLSAVLVVWATMLYPEGYCSRDERAESGRGPLVLFIVAQICLYVGAQLAVLFVHKYLGDYASVPVVVLLGCMWGWMVGRAWLRFELKMAPRAA